MSKIRIAPSRAYAFMAMLGTLPPDGNRSLILKGEDGAK